MGVGHALNFALQTIAHRGGLPHQKKPPPTCRACDAPVMPPHFAAQTQCLRAGLINKSFP
ncbi:MAG: hypothetical protein CFE38_04340 [Comamonadaceae bacterium PBBC1]|nr:MAG: hypothetical protein CFE38_04340 [Comamonadaceae bacterium PBBC1]